MTSTSSNHKSNSSRNELACFSVVFLKNLPITLLVLLFYSPFKTLAQSLDKPEFLGKASTGEEVWYYGGRDQCGEFPRSHECFKNPMIMYTLGDKTFNTVVDCNKLIFKEVSDLSGKRYYNVHPSSIATNTMVKKACAEQAKAYKAGILWERHRKQ